MKEGIVINKVRKWHEPKTKITITKEGIFEEIKLDDFIKALKEEIGSVTTTLTKKQWDEKYESAVNRVIEGL